MSERQKNERDPKEALLVYLEMVLELKSFSTVNTLEAPKDRGLVVADHVSLQAVHVGKLLLADSTLLKQYNYNVIYYGHA